MNPTNDSTHLSTEAIRRLRVAPRPSLPVAGSRLALLLVSATLGSACVSDSTYADSLGSATGRDRAGPRDHTDSREGSDAESGSDASAADTEESPLFAIASTTFGPDGESSYVALVPSLERNTRIEYGAVLELAGGASVFGLNGSHFFALGSGESPSITRFEIDADGNFVEGETLSFAEYGISSMWMDPGLVPIVSETKAYVIDSGQMQVITWNPTTMRVSGSFALDGVAHEDYDSTLFEPDPTQRGTDILVVALHGASDATAPFSTLVVLDSERDRLVNVAREERCGGLWDSVVDGRGDTYFATGVWDAAQHRALGEEFSSAPCLVRVKAGEAAFDPDYFVELSNLTGGRTAGALVGAGANRAFIKVLDDSQLGEIDAEDFDEVWSGSHWQWWGVELGSSEPASKDTELPASAGASGSLTVDTATYVRNANADFSETTLIRMTLNGPEEGITVRGFPYGVVRVR